MQFKSRGRPENAPPDPPVGPDFVCPRKLFTCDNKECILPKYQCDGEKDCNDGSDEKNCGRPKPKKNKKAKKADKNAKKTDKKKNKKKKNKKNKKGKKIVEEEEPENLGDRDAPYNDRNFKCPVNMFTCKNKECVLESYKCDGKFNITVIYFSA